MGNFSDKVKILYLSLVILFSMGIFVYLMDSWGIFPLENYIPGIKEEPPRVPEGDDSPTELELERIRKREEALNEKEIALKEMEASLASHQADLDKAQEEIETMRQSIAAEKADIEQKQAQSLERSKMIREMADRLNAMPPDAAIGIVTGWSDTDLVDVFLQMERDAADAGRPSIVPYLLTKLPKERASLVTTLMMDAEARKLPQ